MYVLSQLSSHAAGKDEAIISAVGALWPLGSVEFSDSDEEDERVGPGLGNGHDEGLASFPVDSWEDSWDDSDAPVSQEVPPDCPPHTLHFTRQYFAILPKIVTLS